ncbi:MAG: preprotein translocase subunit SecE [Polyangiales bacterium]
MSTQPERAASLQLGTAKYLYTGYFVGGCIVAYLVSHLTEAVWAGHENAANVIGVVVGIVGVALAWRNERLRSLAMETIEELAAVTWPTKEETTNATLVVLGTSVVAAVVVFGLDRFWNWFTNLIYLSE